jgi:ABC-type glycerol-3-phosphate transport system permease component
MDQNENKQTSSQAETSTKGNSGTPWGTIVAAGIFSLLAIGLVVFFFLLVQHPVNSNPFL